MTTLIYGWCVAITMLILFTEIRKYRTILNRELKMTERALALWVFLGVVFPLGLWVAYKIHQRNQALNHE